MKKFINLLKSNILIVIIALVLFGGIGVTYAAVISIQSSELDYTTSKSNKIENVKDAIDYLYQKAPKDNEDSGGSTNVSDGGFVTKSTNFASHVISLYTGTDGDNEIYYHDGNGSYDIDGTIVQASEIEAKSSDGIFEESYRYSGESNYVDNYVCFGADTCDYLTNPSNLYRIIGVFKNLTTEKYEVKIIKAKAATTTELGEACSKSSDLFYWTCQYNIYQNTYRALINNALNDYYLNTYLAGIAEKWENIISDGYWNVNGIYSMGTTVATYSTEMPTLSNTITNKIGLMYASDYGYSMLPKMWNINLSDTNAGFKNYTWLFEINSPGCTISKKNDTNNSIWCIDADEGYLWGSGASGGFYYRPTLYLKSDVMVNSGNGTIKYPFIISI